MDVSVANMSQGQRTFEKTKEKTKNNIGTIATAAGGIVATVGTAKLIDKVLDAKDIVSVKGFYNDGNDLISKVVKSIDGKMPEKYNKPLNKSTEFLANIGTHCAKFYVKLSTTFDNSKLKKTLTEFIDNYKKSGNTEKGACIILGAVGAVSAIATVAKAITTHFKNKQIEQKYN